MPVTSSHADAENIAHRSADDVDVLIVGAGISGLDAAHHLRQRFPERTFAIVDALPDYGGTWWTHRFPGARSDSDLYTFGYAHKPWTGDPIATSSEIRAYLGELIDEDGLESSIRYRHRVVKAQWVSSAPGWTVTLLRDDTDHEVTLRCKFLWLCSGYYRHDRPHVPAWTGIDRFAGTVVHPQDWPDDLDWNDKRVVVVGSGATAATVVPAVAERARHVVMLQRSPSFYLTMPRRNDLAEHLRVLDIPAEWTHEILRRKHIVEQSKLIELCRDHPARARTILLEAVNGQLPDDVDAATHFTPRHDPWQQRIAVLPDGDLFSAIRRGAVSVVTDSIDSFTETGISTESGEHIDADIVVTATGFDLNVLGDIEFVVDGAPVDITECVTWRGIMISTIPNMAYTFGYLRHSWTLRTQLVCELVCRLLEHMNERQADVVTPLPPQQSIEIRPFLDRDDFNPNYLLRSQHRMFKQGDRAPWTHLHGYSEELETLPDADLDDGSLVYR